MVGDARECRAQDPRKCYYHGAVIAMNEAMVRVSNSGGNPDAADFDVIYQARLRIDKAEEELRKQQWLNEAMGNQNPQPSTPSTQPATTGPDTANTPAPHLPGNQPAVVGVAAQKLPPREPIVPAPAVKYNDNVFPPQVGPYHDADGNLVVFTRHDKGNGIPNGIMLAGSRELTDDERAHLMNLLRYQHTMSTRVNGKARTIHDDDVVQDHTQRSMFLRSQFQKNHPEEVKAFHDKFNALMKEGTPPRKDGTQKIPPFRDNVEIVLYYT